MAFIPKEEITRLKTETDLSLAKTKMTEVESKIADACDKMKGFEKKES
ncbi:hypothetical protein [Leptospira weilii]|nr:hypothetical protein [Leptospira weilii]ULH27709.1 hypothetical protein FH586_15060 [Leptospira weilii]